MATKAGKETVGMVCDVCKSRNYSTVRNKINIEGKLSLRKYCHTCNKHTEHRETTKLK